MSLVIVYAFIYIFFKKEYWYNYRISCFIADKCEPRCSPFPESRRKRFAFIYPALLFSRTNFAYELIAKSIFSTGVLSSDFFFT